MPGRKSKREPITPAPHDEAEVKDDTPNSPKRGRKENEQKRRILMNQYFDELVVLLTLLSQRHVPKKMDKVATLRETIICLKVYYHLTSLPPLITSSGSNLLNKIFSRGDALQLILNSQDSFLIMVSSSGRVMYSNPLVTSLLGYMQVRLIGQNWYDYIHDQDREVFHSLFTLPLGGEKVSDTSVTCYPPQFCTLHLRLYAGETGGQPQFLPFNCIGYLRKWGAGELLDQDPPSPDEMCGELAPPMVGNQMFVLLVGKLPTLLTPLDLPISTNSVDFEFEFRVSREGRIISVDKHAILLIGYSTSEIIGTLLFDYVDPYHLADMAESISTFSNTGMGTTTPYRFMTKSSRYIWLISKTYTSYNPWVNKPDHILVTNRVLGCDQVLPEHKFYRSRKVLPGFDSNEDFVLSSSCLPPPSPLLDSPNLQQNPLVLQYHKSMELSAGMKGQVPARFPGVSQSPTPPHTIPIRVPPISQQSNWSMPPPSQASNQIMPPRLLEIQKELEMKNLKIMEMQQKLLEQQKQLETERNQFYQVSQQMLNIAPAQQSKNQKISSAMSPMCPSPISHYQDCTTGMYTSSFSPATPSQAASVFSPGSNYDYCPSPGSNLSSYAQSPLQNNVLMPHTPSTMPLSMEMPFYNPSPSTAYPPRTLGNYGQSSLAAHNNLACNSLGLSNSFQSSNQSPAISHIEALSNVLGGR